MITSNLKKNLNTSFKNMINKIILNDSVQVDQFDAIIDGTNLVVEFEIPEEVSLLQKIDFLEEDTLLSTCRVHVPVTGNTLFKYRVEVE